MRIWNDDYTLEQITNNSRKNMLEHLDIRFEELREEGPATLKLRAEVEIVAPGSLPNDGKVIDDQRDYDS